MGKLNRRQIVILGIMLLAVFYGGYDFFSTGRKSHTVVDQTRKTTDLNALMGDITSALTTEASSPVEAYMIKRAEAAWPRDLFYEPINKHEEALEKAAAHAQQVEAETSSIKGQLSYTGYLDTGSRKIAIVNGYEYVAGDSLDVEGYVLKGIYPGKIVIFNKINQLSIEIPLKE